MIQSIEELDAIKQSCRSMVTKSSRFSAGTAIIPIPGLDIGSDVAILLRLIPKINENLAYRLNKLIAWIRNPSYL